MSPWRITLIVAVICQGLAAADAPIAPGALKNRIAALTPAGQTRALAKLATHPTLRAHHAQLRAEAHGGLYFAECPAAAAGSAPAAAATPTVGVRLAPQAAPPVYHSRLGSANQIVLDFMGGAITGTAWNQAVADGGVGRDPIVALGYDIDGDPSTFNTAEQTFIQRVWARVAEDYAPFDIDVTTTIPGTWTATTLRILITKSTDSGGGDNPSKTGGGVAFVGTFGDTSLVTGSVPAWQYYTPAWVYYDNLPHYSSGSLPPIADYVAEAAAHEAGHNLGLSHEGVSGGSSYYSGHGSGATSWAPIMGAAYDREITQWAHGEYTSANNTEDQISIIASYTGFCAQDRGSLTTTATALTVSGGTITAGDPGNAGIIGRSGELDVYRFDAGVGPISISVTPVSLGTYTRGCDLDVRAQLLDVNGTMLANINPAGDPAASIAVTLATPGYHYLRITGGSEATPTTGYSSYASQGSYAISGTVTVNGPGDLDFTNVTVQTHRPSSGTANVTLTLRRQTGSDGIVSVAWTTSDGSAVAGTDYTASSGTVTWADRDLTNQTITVPLLVHAAISGDNTFSVALSSPSGGSALGSVTTATVTISAPVVPPSSAASTINRGGGGGGGCGAGALGALIILFGSFVLRLRARQSFSRRV